MQVRQPGNSYSQETNYLWKKKNDVLEHKNQFTYIKLNKRYFMQYTKCEDLKNLSMH